ncbi:MAG: hypothetical protein CMH58_10185 [Myxococcales bacterium]|nr:hypothetical protein [Myxococcales bacterium]
MIRQPLYLLPLLLVGACPKEAEIIQIPGPHCEIRVAFQAPESLGQPLRPEGSPNITVLDLELSSENGLQERQLSVVDRSGVLSVEGEPLQIRENEQFTLRITGRSESGDIVSQGQSKSFGCGLDTEQETVNVTVNFLPVNRWIPVSIPNDLARVGHQQVAVGDGLLIVGGRRPSGLATPPSPSDAGVPTQDTGDSSSDAGHSTDGGDPASSGPEAGPTPEAGILDGGPLDTGVSPDAAAPVPGQDGGTESGANHGLLGPTVETGIAYFQMASTRFLTGSDIAGNTDFLRNYQAMAVYTQTDRACAFILGGSTEFPPGEQGLAFYFDAEDEVKISDPVQRMSAALEGLLYPQAVPLQHGLHHLALLGGVKGGRSASWPVRSAILPSTMVLVDVDHFTTRSEPLLQNRQGETPLGFRPMVASFGDGSALIAGGSAVDENGIVGPTTAASHLLYEDRNSGSFIMPYLDEARAEPLALPRRNGIAVSVHDQLVVFIGGLDAMPADGQMVAELYRWSPGPVPGRARGGSLIHSPITRFTNSQSHWGRGMAALKMTCRTGETYCPILVVGGATEAGNGSTSARLLLLKSEVDPNSGRANWVLDEEPLDDLPAPLWGAQITRLQDGTLMVFGGLDRPEETGGQPATQAYLYNWAN